MLGLGWTGLALVDWVGKVDRKVSKGREKEQEAVSSHCNSRNLAVVNFSMVSDVEVRLSDCSRV